MKVEILTPEKKVFSGNADGVQLPGTAGLFEILNNHAPLISSLTNGRVRIRRDRDEHIFNISGGFVEVLNNQVTVLAESVTS